MNTIIRLFFNKLIELDVNQLDERSFSFHLYNFILNSFNNFDTEISLEHPHPDLPGMQIDSFIRIKNIRNFFELKTHFKPPNSNPSKPGLTGKVLKDIFRLNAISEEENMLTNRFFVYMTDNYMQDYLIKDERLRIYFSLGENESITITEDMINDLQATIRNTIGDIVAKTKMVNLFREKFDNYNFYFFQIHPQN